MSSSFGRIERFLRRHAWSVSLSALSTLSFVRLASEMREGELRPFDAAATQALVGFRGHVDGTMLALTTMGGFAGMTTLCVLGALVLSKLGKRREATFLVTCGIGAAVLSTLLKLLFHRARPGASSLYLLTSPDSFSFPSGHALGTTSVVGGLAVVAFALLGERSWRALAAAVALFFVSGVAASRVYFGMHFPSDVIGGVLAGAAWVAAVTGWFYPRLLPGEVSGKNP